MKLKICGLKYPENIYEIISLKPDYLGFIFYPKSSRFVEEIDFIQDIAFENKVAVFVNESKENILKIISKTQIRILQLHGDESPAMCEELKNTYLLTIIKVFSVDENFDFELLNPYKTVVDYFLFDTKGKDYGGNGVPFDWNILKKYDNQIPFFLSGGISLQNIESLFQFLKDNPLNIYALDVNSKFETEPAKKDVEKLKQLKQFLANGDEQRR